MDPSWRTIAATIRNEFHRPPAAPSAAAPSTAEIPSSAPVPPPAWGVVRYEAGGYQTSSGGMDDGTVSGVRRQLNRIVEPPVNNQPRTFDPYSVTQAEYNDLRNRGYVPKVVVEGAPVTSKSDSFDLPEYMKQRKSMERRHEMDDFLNSRRIEMESYKKSRTADMDTYLAARQRGEIPS